MSWWDIILIAGAASFATVAGVVLFLAWLMAPVFEIAEGFVKAYTKRR